jgi:hypothetical protein
VALIGPIQAYKSRKFDILIRHQYISPLFPRFKTVPVGSAHKPYSRVLEGQHLSICPASRADPRRKSPLTVDPVGWLIRNAAQPVFHKGNSLQKEKEKRTKKEKENPVENAAAVEIGKKHRWPSAPFSLCRFPPLLGKASLDARLSHISHRTDDDT